MVKDKELVAMVEFQLRRISNTAELDDDDNAFVVADSIREKLQVELLLDLTEKADLIRGSILAFLMPPQLRPPPTTARKKGLLLFSDKELADAVGQQLFWMSLIRDPALKHHETTVDTIRLELEDILGVDLSDKTSLIRDRTKGFFHPKGPAPSSPSKKRDCIKAFPPWRSTSSDDKSLTDAGVQGTERPGIPGFMMMLYFAFPELKAVIGKDIMPRAEIVRQLWDYIRKNNLVDPDDDLMVWCDDKLQALFGTNVTDVFQVHRILAQNVIPFSPQTSEFKSLREVKMMISDELARFLNVNEIVMTHMDAVEQVWDYIIMSQREIPSSTSIILCDTRLQQLFGHASLDASLVTELLSGHFSELS